MKCLASIVLLLQQTMAQSARQINARMGVKASGTIATTIAENRIAGFADGARRLSQSNYSMSVTATSGGVMYLSYQGLENIYTRLTASKDTVGTLARDGVLVLATFGITSRGDVRVEYHDYCQMRHLNISTMPNTTLLGSGCLSHRNVRKSMLDEPLGVAFDATTGHVYVADRRNHAILSILDDQVTLVGGTGHCGWHDGSLKEAIFCFPRSITLGSRSDIYVSEPVRIRRIDIRHANVSTVAGNGIRGLRDGDAKVAMFNDANGLAMDTSGVIYVIDAGNFCIRRVLPNVRVTTLESKLLAGFFNGWAPNVHTHCPYGIAVDSFGDVHLKDFYHKSTRTVYANDHLRRRDLDIHSEMGLNNMSWPNGVVVTTIAGTGIAGSEDGVASLSQFTNPFIVTATSSGAIYVVELLPDMFRIRLIAPNGTVSTLKRIKVRPFVDEGFAAAVAVGPDGNAYLFSMNECRVQHLNVLPSRVPSVVWDDCDFNKTLDPEEQRLPNIAVDVKTGSVYFVGYTQSKIWRILHDQVTTVAGTGHSSYYDGSLKDARFSEPLSIAVGPRGDLYVGESVRIRQIDLHNRIVSTVAGNGIRGFRDGDAKEAKFDEVFSIAVDATGVIYAADSKNFRIRRVLPNVNVTTLAGSGIMGLLDGDAQKAQFGYLLGITVSNNGDVFVPDVRHNVIRRVHTNRASVCACENGTPVNGLLCLSFVGNACSKCNKGYHLVGEKIKACEDLEITVHPARLRTPKDTSISMIECDPLSTNDKCNPLGFDPQSIYMRDGGFDWSAAPNGAVPQMQVAPIPHNTTTYGIQFVIKVRQPRESSNIRVLHYDNVRGISIENGIAIYNYTLVNGTTVTVQTSKPITEGWHHFVFTSTLGEKYHEFEIYIDGVSQSKTLVPRNAPVCAQLALPEDDCAASGVLGPSRRVNATLRGFAVVDLALPGNKVPNLFEQVEWIQPLEQSLTFRRTDQAKTDSLRLDDAARDALKTVIFHALKKRNDLLEILFSKSAIKITEFQSRSHTLRSRRRLSEENLFINYAVHAIQSAVEQVRRLMEGVKWNETLRNELKTHDFFTPYESVIATNVSVEPLTRYFAASLQTGDGSALSTLKPRTLETTEGGETTKTPKQTKAQTRFLAWVIGLATSCIVGLFALCAYLYGRQRYQPHFPQYLAEAIHSACDLDLNENRISDASTMNEQRGNPVSNAVCSTIPDHDSAFQPALSTSKPESTVVNMPPRLVTQSSNSLLLSDNVLRSSSIVFDSNHVPKVPQLPCADAACIEDHLWRGSSSVVLDANRLPQLSSDRASRLEDQFCHGSSSIFQRDPLRDAQNSGKPITHLCDVPRRQTSVTGKHSCSPTVDFHTEHRKLSHAILSESPTNVAHGCTLCQAKSVGGAHTTSETQTPAGATACEPENADDTAASLRGMVGSIQSVLRSFFFKV